MTLTNDPGFLRLEGMPFIRGSNFWAVESPEDYDEGWQVGEHMAHLALMLAPDCLGAGLPWLLGSVALDQVGRGAKTAGDRGTILGFWNTIGKFAAAVATPANIARSVANGKAYRRRCEEAEAADKLRRREQCRQAALVGAAKRRKRRDAAARPRASGGTVVPIGSRKAAGSTAARA